MVRGILLFELGSDCANGATGAREWFTREFLRSLTPPSNVCLALVALAQIKHQPTVTCKQSTIECYIIDISVISVALAY